MATPDPKTPTRDQLFKVFQNHELVRLFEKLFERAGEINPDDIATLTILIEEVNIGAGIADGKANQANDLAIRLREAAQMAILEVGTASAKANQAIGASIENKVTANEALTLSWLLTN